MNKVILIGYVGKEPVCSVSKNGKEIAKLTLAVTRTYNREETDWFNCAIFGASVTNFIKPFVHKGAMVCIEGEIQFSRYTSKEGSTKSNTNIIVSHIQLLKNNDGSVDIKSTEVEVGSPADVAEGEESSLPF